MAFTGAFTTPARIPTTSYDTALCIIPPRSQGGHVDQLRELYDKAFGRWPAHVNLIYPFVAPENLPRAKQQIQEHFAEHLDQSKPVDVKLGQAGCFAQKNKYTIFLTEDNEKASPSTLQSLRTIALESLGQKTVQSTLHLTVGQSQDSTILSRAFLLEKARLLPALQFGVARLAILIRERVTGSESTDHMRLYDTIDICSGSVSQLDESNYWVQRLPSSVTALGYEEDAQDEMAQREIKPYDQGVQSGSTFHFDEDEYKWAAYSAEDAEIEVEALSVASYNVLIDTEYPPTHDRDPLLISTILSDSAMANILVLQEVSDDFLSYLLSDGEIQRRYPFASHGPPAQPDIGPLPNLRNIVVLSCYPFSWKLVSFYRRHKGAIVAHFPGIAASGSADSQGLVIAGVHLTAGLTDGAVATKRAQMKTLVGYLEQNHDEEPWIVTGDFNLVTSTYTIDAACKNKAITDETANTLVSIETSISDAGLLDAWSVSRVEATDQTRIADAGELFEGEEGATFDPQNNRLAAGTTTTSHDRPQRYDRILVRPKHTLRISRFNHFGLPEIIDDVQVVASDHYGVRTQMRIASGVADNAINTDAVNQPVVQMKRSIVTLSDASAINSVLAVHGMIPDEEQAKQRQDAFSTLQQVILNKPSDAESEQSDIPLVMVPVGSYALGVWTSNSDVDCLCIGTISSKTFFKLARQRLIKAGDTQVRILRKVEASTGTMLELSINGILMDLQYCPAAQVVER